MDDKAKRNRHWVMFIYLFPFWSTFWHCQTHFANLTCCIVDLFLNKSFMIGVVYELLLSDDFKFIICMLHLFSSKCYKLWIILFFITFVIFDIPRCLLFYQSYKHFILFCIFFWLQCLLDTLQNMCCTYPMQYVVVGSRFACNVI